MTSDETQRKLAAIMLADIAHFSSLMERDETRTFTRVRQFRDQLVSPLILHHSGRIIKTTGDGFLAEFASPTLALECAIAIQRANHEQELSVAAADRLHLRIGLNVGDIIIDGDDVAGDGVNIAARLQLLSPEDGVCISNMVRDQVREDLGVRYDDLGEQQVKNIARPIRAYNINLFPNSSTSGNKSVFNHLKVQAKSNRAFYAVIGVLVIFLVVAGLFGLDYWQEEVKTADTASTKAAKAPRFSIVVLPFVNNSGDPGQEYIADGITDEVTTQLSKIKGSFVIASGTAFTFKGKTVDIKTIAKQLNVRYVLQGSVAKLATGFSMNAQLTDGATGQNLWADNFAAGLGRVDDLRTNLVRLIAIELDLQLTAIEAKKSSQSNNPDAVDYTLLGWTIFRKPTNKEGLLKARGLFEKALTRQSDYPSAFVGLSRVDAYLADFQGGPQYFQLLSTAERNAKLAISLDPFDASAHLALSTSLMYQVRTEEALRANARALELNPNYPEALNVLGMLKIFTGKAAEGIPHFERALELSPLDPSRFLTFFRFCHAYMHIGKFEKAIAKCEDSIEGLPNYWPPSSDLLAAYTALGNREKAEAEKVRLLRIKPDFSISSYRALRYSNNPQWRKEIEENIWANLSKAGIPE